MTMSDVLDEIIDKLSPSTLKMISEFDGDCLQDSSKLNDLLNETRQIKTRQITKEFERKIFDLKTKTVENKNCLIKLKNELEALRSMKEHTGNQQNVKPYVEKINELQIQLKKLTEDTGEVDFNDLFNDIEHLNHQIQEYQKKINEAKSKYECFEDFPPNIEEAEEAVAQVKEKIKQNEAIVESFY